MIARRTRNSLLTALVVLECAAFLWVLNRTLFLGWLTATPQDSVRTRQLFYIWFVVGLMVLIGICLTVAYWVTRADDDRQSLEGKCTSCGYDLTGLEGSTCPECGTSHQ